MPACPVTCPCRRGGEGGFLLAGAAYVALAGPLFLGADLGRLIEAALEPPHALTLALQLWLLAVLAGLVLLGIAVRTLLVRGDAPPALSSFAVIMAATIALGCGWYPETLGARWFYGVRGLYLALIAGGLVNLGFAFCARLWLAGYVAAESGWLSYTGTRPDEDQAHVIAGLNDALARLGAERDAYAGEVARLQSETRGGGVAELVDLLGGRRRVLARLHPDTVDGEAGKHAATERFQKVAALLERAGVR